MLHIMRIDNRQCARWSETIFNPGPIEDDIVRTNRSTAHRGGH